MGMMLEKIRLLVFRINDVEGRACVVASALVSLKLFNQ